MAYTASFSVNVGDPTKANDVATLAANDDFLKTAIDKIMADSATPTFALANGVTATTQSAGNNSTLLSTTAYADAAGVSLSGSTNNTIATVTGANALVGEANLTFDGSKLTVTGDQYIANGYGLVIGHTAQVAVNGQLGEFQLHGTADADGTVIQSLNAASSLGPVHYFAKSRNASVGSFTAVQNGDSFGRIMFFGDDGTDFGSWGAGIFANVDGTPGSNDMPGRLTFYTTADGAASGTERMRIDSSGNVGIGNSAMSTYNGNTLSLVIGSTGLGSGGSSSISLAAPTDGYNSLEFTDTAATSSQGGVFYNHNNDSLNFKVSGVSYPLQISSSGKVGIGVAPPNAGLLHLAQPSSGNGYALIYSEHAGSSLPYGFSIDFSAASPDNNAQYFLYGQDSTTARIYIWSDGDLANHDGTYGTISDVKFKQDITDARGYWDDFKALQYRKFRHKTDVEADPDAPYRLGLIAQEVETVFPALAPESPDPDITETINVIETILDDGGEPVLDADGNETTRVVMIPVVDEEGEPILDADGNETLEAKTEEVTTPSGTTHKWVKSSIIEGPIMASVVQELMARVEALEAA